MGAFTNDLQEKIEQLTDIIDGKDLQVRVLENELTDVVKPHAILSRVRVTVFEMEEEIIEFEKQKGKSERTKKSMDRLLGLSEQLSSLDAIATASYNLKAINKEIHANYQLLRIENMELKKKLQAVKEAEEWE